jgi:hypothetical protein
VLEPIEDARGLLEFTLHEANLALDLGMQDAGAEALARASGWLEHAQNREQRAEWLRLSGRAQLLAHDFEAARRSIAEAIAVASQSGSVLAELGAALAQAEAELAAGDIGIARALLPKLHGEAERLGHVALMLRAGELLARVAITAHDLGAAEQQLRADLQRANMHRPYAFTFRIHALLAEVLRTTGRTSEANEHERAAAMELERLWGELGPAQRAAFSELDEVRRIRARAALDTAA